MITLNENDLNLFIKYVMEYKLKSEEDISDIKEIIDQNKFPKSTYNLILKYLEKGIYNNKIKVNKQDYLNFRNELQQKLKTK